MARELTMRVHGTGGTGDPVYPPAQVENYQVVTYEVCGLPAGEEAQIMIREFSGNRWQVRRFKDGVVQGDWTGDYKSEHEALDALAKQYNG